MNTRVLVVDDHIAVRRFVSTLLAGAGYEVHQVSNGEEALTAATAGKFSLLVSDIGLPGINGIDLLTQLREIDPALPAVLMSGDPSLAGRVEHVMSQTRFLAKPFTSWELLSAVGRLLNPEGGRIREGQPPLLECIPPSLDLESTPFEFDSAIVYTLDDGLRIVSCNLAWNQFAASNGAIHLHRRDIRGMPLSGFLHGELKSYYQRAFRFVLDTGRTWQHEYECSSPDNFRKFAMRVYRAHQGLLVANSLLVEEPVSRPRSAPVVEAYRDWEGIILMCSNCRRTRRGSEKQVWDWVPAFVAHPIQPIEHALCPSCSDQYQLDAVA